jgi:hypothetical protein
MQETNFSWTNQRWIPMRGYLRCSPSHAGDSAVWLESHAHLHVREFPASMPRSEGA